MKKKNTYIFTCTISCVSFSAPAFAAIVAFLSTPLSLSLSHRKGNGRFQAPPPNTSSFEQQLHPSTVRSLHPHHVAILLLFYCYSHSTVSSDSMLTSAWHDMQKSHVGPTFSSSNTLISWSWGLHSGPNFIPIWIILSTITNSTWKMRFYYLSKSLLLQADRSNSETSLLMKWNLPELMLVEGWYEWFQSKVFFVHFQNETFPEWMPNSPRLSHVKTPM